MATVFFVGLLTRVRRRQPPAASATIPPLLMLAPGWPHKQRRWDKSETWTVLIVLGMLVYIVVVYLL